MKLIKKVFKGIERFFSAPFRGYKKLKKPIRRLICLVLVAAIATGGYFGWNYYKSKETSSESKTGTSIVRMGNLTNSITGSGTVEPIEQRDIVPEVNGKIIEAPFEEGDSVKTGDVLYRFEMTAATNAIKTAENNVEKAQTTLSNRKNSIDKVQENIQKLTVYAPSSGKIDDISLLVGEEASGKIATLVNFKEQTATIPFASAQIGNIKVNDSVDVAIDKYMINTTGTVVRKYTAPETLKSGAVVYNVEIRLSNNYTVEENVNVTATVHTKSGDISSASYGSVKYADPVTVSAEQKGKVKKVNFKNGDWVNKGDVIAVLENSDLSEELKTAQQNYTEAQMNLTEAMNTLEDKKEAANEYIVTSPIDGVVLTKDYTVGDTISGQNSTTMMVVADMSKMKFTISADELDIAKIQLGQNVSVTADALENERLEGTITSVSKLGTASNGVTNYPIEVTIDQPGDLMPGMNVSAQIIIEQTTNSLYLPVEAVEYFDGKYYVTIVGEVENMPEPNTQRGFGGGSFGQNRTTGENADGEATSRGNRQRSENGDIPGRGNRQRSENSNAETRTQTPSGDTTVSNENQQTKTATPAESGNNQQTKTDVTAENGNNQQAANGEATSRGGWQRSENGDTPGRGNWQRGENNTAGSPRQTGGETVSQRPGTVSAAEVPVNKEESNTDEKTASNKKDDTKSKSETEEKSAENEAADKGSESGERTGSQGRERGGNRQGGNQEELKIKYYEKEQRVEVKIGITTDTAYEILEGVSYGQVVKNTTQTTSSSTTNNRGGMGGFGGGMSGMGGFGGGMNMGGGNRNGMNMGGGNRSTNTGGRR